MGVIVTYFLLNRQEFVNSKQDEKTEHKHSLLFTLKAPWKVNLEQYETEFKNTAGKVNHQADHYMNRYDASNRRNDVWVTLKMKSDFCRLECNEIAGKTSYEDCTTRPGTGKQCRIVIEFSCFLCLERVSAIIIVPYPQNCFERRQRV